ncbi:uncharacterized protein SCODWIG_01487 [Saccharomycodes ludwigii]|uniref:Protein kinase domain-containing protein n=1 Tax=Saccharomycodes ludwigii TaxID=36035 RepID=A0A376B4V7_9ASCO|nr:uncharacterized protein SCODWIG_01487 [Saccharomycodes ludwigii]
MKKLQKQQVSPSSYYSTPHTSLKPIDVLNKQQDSNSIVDKRRRLIYTNKNSPNRNISSTTPKSFGEKGILSITTPNANNNIQNGDDDDDDDDDLVGPPKLSNFASEILLKPSTNEYVNTLPQQNILLSSPTNTNTTNVMTKNRPSTLTNHTIVEKGDDIHNTINKGTGFPGNESFSQSLLDIKENLRNELGTIEDNFSTNNYKLNIKTIPNDTQANIQQQFTARRRNRRFISTRLGLLGPAKRSGSHTGYFTDESVDNDEFSCNNNNNNINKYHDIDFGNLNPYQYSKLHNIAPEDFPIITRIYFEKQKEQLHNIYNNSASNINTDVIGNKIKTKRNLTNVRHDMAQISSKKDDNNKSINVTTDIQRERYGCNRSFASSLINIIPTKGDNIRSSSVFHNNNKSDNNFILNENRVTTADSRTFIEQEKKKFLEEQYLSNSINHKVSNNCDVEKRKISSISDVTPFVNNNNNNNNNNSGNDERNGILEPYLREPLLELEPNVIEPELKKTKKVKHVSMGRAYQGSQIIPLKPPALDLYANNNKSNASIITNNSNGNSVTNITDARLITTVNGVIYEKIELLGKGGSSKVYKVRKINTPANSNKIYALKKVIFDEFDDSSVQGFKGEIELLCNLRGKSRVVQLVDYEIQTGILFAIMECGDHDLSQVLQNRITMPLDVEFVRYHFKEMLYCVKQVHDSDIVHSDLKPANFVFVCGILKIIDFGIANEVPDYTVNIYRETQIGTPNYMAPEALVAMEKERRANDQQGENATRDEAQPIWKVGKPSDIWSCGCILYQMVYGKPPYASFQGQERLLAIMNPNVKISYPERGLGGCLIPKTILELIKMCLRRNPEQRATIDEILATSLFLNPVVVSKNFINDLVKNAVQFGVNQQHQISPNTIDKLSNEVWNRLENLKL